MERKPATYADLEALPDNRVGQIFGGVLHVSPRPAGPHTVAASLLGGALVLPFVGGQGGPCGWLILDEPQLYLGQDVLVPDLAGWRRERMPQAPDTGAFTLRRRSPWTARRSGPCTRARACGTSGCWTPGHAPWRCFVPPLLPGRCLKPRARLLRTCLGTRNGRSSAPGAKTPWNLVRFAQGGGTRDATRRKSSSPVKSRYVVPSGSGRFLHKRSIASAPRAP